MNLKATTLKLLYQTGSSSPNSCPKGAEVTEGHLRRKGGEGLQIVTWERDTEKTLGGDPGEAPPS